MTSDEPTISVVMINKNCARWIGEAIGSVLAQTHARLELVVVDDASTDDSREVVAGYAARDPRVVLVTSPVTLYTSGARNLGIERATGDYVSFLDADDRMLPDTLVRQLAAFRAARARNPRVQLVCFDAYTLSEGGDRVSRYMGTEYWGVVRDEDAPGWALPSTWFFPRAIAARFHPAWLVAEAGPFLDRIRRDGGFTYVGEPVVEYRMRMTSATLEHARNMMRAFAATDATIAAGRSWDDPITPDQVPEPRWADLATWKYGRLAKSAAVNRRPLVALGALALASVAKPGPTLRKVAAELRRLVSTPRRRGAGRTETGRA